MQVSRRSHSISFSARATLGALLLLSLTAMLATAPAALSAPSRASYVVVLKDDVAHPAYLAHRHERNRGAEITHVYGVAIKGYSAMLTRNELKAIKKDPNVDYAESDGVIQPKGQAVGNQLKRVYANLSNLKINESDVPADQVNADIAILDTGVYAHPDLNVVSRVDCTGGGGGGGCKPGQPNDDQAGHGTHVAGDAAAIDNGIGAVGTAPGARIWSVKVVSQMGHIGSDDVGMILSEPPNPAIDLNLGNAQMSDAIAGIDYVTAHSSEIEVANMSFACSTYEWGCARTALAQAIATSVNSGVVWVAAAGQEGDAVTGIERVGIKIRHYPALLSDVITVSAMADYDGLPGSLSNSNGCPLEKGTQVDDRLMGEGKPSAGTEFTSGGSNFGPEVDIVAPGSCVFSTWSPVVNSNSYDIPYGSTYGFMYGSSVASALVAGAAADIASQFNPNSRADVENIKAALISAGNYNWEDLISAVPPAGPFYSPDGVKEPLLDMRNIAPFPPPPPPPLPPEAATEDNTYVDFHQATLHGSVDPNGASTRYLFQFGTTTSYGADGPEDAVPGLDGFVPVVSTITGLGEGVTYHYRLVAKNAAGYSYGKDRTFTTPASQDSGSWGTRVPSTNPNAQIFTYVRGTTAAGGHLMQTWFDGANWQVKDLGGSVAEGTTPAVVRSPSTNPNAPIYVFYQGSNGHLKQTWYNGSVWSTEDLGIETAMAANASPVAVRAPTTNPNAPIFVFYQGSNGHLKQTWYNESVWSTQDRGAETAMAANTNPTVARVPSTDLNAPINVFYQATNGHLKQTWYNESVWSTQDRGAETAMAPGTSPSVTRIVSTNANVPIAVFYRTPTGKLAETWWNEYVWSTNPAIGSAEIAAGASPAAVRTPSTNANAPIHVFYRGASTGKLTDTWWNESAWSTEAKGTEVLATGATPVVLRPSTTNPNASIFTFYKGSGGFLTQTWFNESVWSTKTLTTAMG